MLSTRKLQSWSGSLLRARSGSLLLIAFYTLGGALVARDLWVDHNPYDPTSRIVEGTVLKLSVDEAMLVDYEFLGNNNEEAKVKLTPDKSITDFLPPANVDRNISGRQESRARGRNKVTFRMGVTVSRVDGDTIEFSGSRLIAPDDGKSRAQFQVSGQVHRQDINGSRTIKSTDVAGLQILMRGGPIPQNKNLPMKNQADPNGAAQPSAAPTPAEKEQMLLQYLNRILGESRDF
ncbi:MAG: flagellar basal body L-ring protein FlgH [Leptospirales bacterium]|nr:flagellar basal body L-ring protein FlgH [Leptospirales bacterium]